MSKPEDDEAQKSVEFIWCHVIAKNNILQTRYHALELSCERWDWVIFKSVYSTKKLLFLKCVGRNRAAYYVLLSAIYPLLYGKMSA